MGFLDVAFIPPRDSFSTTFLKKSWFLELWMVVSNGMLPVAYPCSNIDPLTVSRI